MLSTMPSLLIHAGSLRRSRRLALIRNPTLNLVVIVVFALLGCDSGHRRSAVVVSPLRDFSEVFVAVDTIRLDAAALVGAVHFMDVSDTGELLICDRVTNDFKLFTSQGSFIRTLQTADCSPGTQFAPNSARFIGNGMCRYKRFRQLKSWSPPNLSLRWPAVLPTHSQSSYVVVQMQYVLRSLTLS